MSKRMRRMAPEDSRDFPEGERGEREEQHASDRCCMGPEVGVFRAGPEYRDAERDGAVPEERHEGPSDQRHPEALVARRSAPKKRMSKHPT